LESDIVEGHENVNQSISFHTNSNSSVRPTQVLLMRY